MVCPEDNERVGFPSNRLGWRKVLPTENLITRWVSMLIFSFWQKILPASKIEEIGKKRKDLRKNTELRNGHPMKHLCLYRA